MPARGDTLKWSNTKFKVEQATLYIQSSLIPLVGYGLECDHNNLL